MKHIILAGHFDIGENVTDKQKRTIEDAVKLEGELGILVGDVGVAEKIGAYLKGGIAGVRDTYLDRIVDCETACVMAQLPKEDEILSVIDTAAYEKMAAILREEAPEIAEVLTRVDIDTKNPEYVGIREELQRIVREKIVPELIEDRIQLYGLDPADVTVYSERSLRNRVAHRVRKRAGRGQGSWRHLPGFYQEGKSTYIVPLPEDLEMELAMDEETLTERAERTGHAFNYPTYRVVNRRGVPVCRGIMLALFEKVATEGYEKITQLYDAKHRDAIVKAQAIFQAIAGKLPQTKERRVTFENTFY